MAFEIRIAGGYLKNRKLVSLPGHNTRPISGIIKEALFSVIGPRVKNATILDLFAGTGAVGIEAISRGAASSVFVEMEESALSVIHQNLDNLGNDIVRFIEEQHITSAGTVVIVQHHFKEKITSSSAAEIKMKKYGSTGLDFLYY